MSPDGPWRAAGLVPGRVVVRSLATHALTPEHLARYRAALSAPERAQADRFRFARDRDLYTAAHALLRDALRRHGVPDPVFTVNAWGKPELADHGALRFNLTHTQGLAACAVAWGEPVGLDVETDRPLDFLTLATSAFAPAEVAALRALPEADRAEAFLAVWTLKEAFVKAVGRGLSIPLADFAFGLGPSLELVSFACAPCLGEDAAAWRFRSFALGRHRFGLALRRPEGDLSLDHRIVPPDELAAALGSSGRR